MTITKLISEKRLFILLLVLSPLPVWIVPYFLTADGPCHAYNARILYDMLHGRADFYQQFYYLNTAPEPNWFSHALLLFLFHICGPVLAEKLIVTSAIILFTAGFRKLLLALSKENSFLSLWAFPFVWQAALLMGFYNYMFGISCSFFISAWFITNYKHFRARNLLLLALAFSSLYFMHLFGCLVAFIICGLYILTDTGKVKVKVKHLGVLLLSALPCILLILNYLLDNSGSASTNNSSRLPKEELVSNLNNLSSLYGLTTLDIRMAMKMSSLLQVFIAIGLALFALRKPNRHVFIPGFLFVLFTAAYFLLPEMTFGGSFLRQRIEPLIYLSGLVIISFARIPNAIRIGSICFSVFFSLAFSFNKISSYREASLFVSEIREISTRVRDKSLVLPLNFEHYLQNTNGELINKKTLLFGHVVEAMPHNKQLIFLENYEANTGYFPLIWKGEKNPFLHLSVNDGIEAEPPQVDIIGYNTNVQPINYILTWGKRKEALEHPSYPALIQTVTENYTLVYTSPVYKISLYELKKR